jgi:hypothetical protein
VEEHALDLGEHAVQVFKDIKTAWNNSAQAVAASA